jgi:acyl-[acyl-carrier-protein]-phospholipid O-acyltransferase / long-chain-fatty-acid--[acyl-carrier-protein] ligase
VVSIPDEKKGEQIILITTYPFASRDMLIKYFREQKISELSVPKTIIIVDNLPVLGTGKTDYQAVKNIALLGE